MTTDTGFTSGELAEFAADHGTDVNLLIVSHGETYGIGGLGWDPHKKAITLASTCPYDLPIAALSFEGDPVATAQARHRMAENLAQHLDELAARIRATYPAAVT